MKTVIEILQDHIQCGRHSRESAERWLVINAIVSPEKAHEMLKGAFEI